MVRQSIGLIIVCQRRVLAAVARRPTIVLVMGALAGAAVETDAQEPLLEPRDVVTLRQVAEAQIAPGGEQVVYAVGEADLPSNRTRTTFWRLRLNGGEADSLPIPAEATRLRWRPDGASVSYLAPEGNGVVQVWEYDMRRAPRQLTFHSRPVVSYEWSSDARSVAFVSETRPRPLPAGRGAGVVIDMLDFISPRLLSKKPLDRRNLHSDRERRAELWIHDLASGRETLVTGPPLSVSGFAWSPDARMLAITASGELGRLPRVMAAASLLLYARDDGELDVLEAGAGGDYYDGTITYSDPFWSPDGRHIGYFRLDRKDRFAASPQLGVVSVAERRTVVPIHDEELELHKARAFWLRPDTILIENTHRSSRRLFAIAVGDGSMTAVDDHDDWSDMHSFSSDGRFAAFVRQRIDTPPDLYSLDRRTGERRRLTELNTGLKPPRVEGVRWRGADSVEVDGWLYLPSGAPPFPSLVFVHGGPTFVYGNRYEPYVPYWPHSPSVYAANGIAVLVPNYRGTPSYGKAFRRPSALDDEPVGDIIAGVEMLIETGVADPDRLGIAGHSHGCWLGPLVAVRYRRFAAASCAEGSGDRIAIYERNQGWGNTEIVEFYWGGGDSPYESPEHYRRLSPVYWFAGLRTAFLFEAGELSAPFRGAEYAMAAWRSEVPHEFVIYPRTHHNVTEPQIMVESMQRNLEWFEFWLLDRERLGEGKHEQYERWRDMRAGGRGAK